METVNEKMTMIRLSQINDKYPDLIKHILFTCDETFTLKESLSVNVSIQLHRSWEDEILWETYQRTEFPNFRVAYELDSKHYHFYKMTYESFRKGKDIGNRKNDFQNLIQWFKTSHTILTSVTTHSINLVRQK